MEFNKDLNAASASPLILAVLQEQPSYGYSIIKQVAELSEGQLEWAEGMLYPVLHRLEKLGQIESFWQASENGRKRKYYRIKEPGMEALQTHREQWKTMNSILEQSWKNIRFPEDGSDPCVPVLS